jgi:hypothetical protein
MTDDRYSQTAAPTTKEHEGTLTATKPENTNTSTKSNQDKVIQSNARN